jgi:hypothetical protein
MSTGYFAIVGTVKSIVVEVPSLLRAGCLMIAGMKPMNAAVLVLTPATALIAEGISST